MNELSVKGGYRVKDPGGIRRKKAIQTEASSEGLHINILVPG